MTVILDPREDLVHTRAALAVHAPEAGRLTVHPTPGTDSVLTLVYDVLAVLDKPVPLTGYRRLDTAPVGVLENVLSEVRMNVLSEMTGCSLGSVGGSPEAEEPRPPRGPRREVLQRAGALVVALQQFFGDAHVAEISQGLLHCG